MSGMRLSSRPVQTNLRADGRPTEEEFVFAAARFTAGQITSFDTQSIPPEAAVELTNVFLRQDKLSRRSGTTNITPSKPNSNAILGIAAVQLFDGTVKQLRFDHQKVYLRTGTWVEITGAGLSGVDTDRFTLLYSNDETFFANNGANALQKINFGTNAYAAAGNAPRYKYWCSFYNRIVGAHLAGPTANPIEIGWSGDLNFSEFDPNVDFSAGLNWLVESQSDLSDEITGLFAFAQTMVILRQQTVWVATKQPSATSPFAFYTAIPGIGCDSPYSAIQVPNGIIWYDRRTGNVWYYQVGADMPQNVSPPVDLELAASVADQTQIFGAYDPYNNVYQLASPIPSSSLVKMWNFNLGTGAWWTEVVDGLTALDNLAVSGTSITIDDLLGTIDSLVGTIDSLSPSVIRPTRFYGFSDGNIRTRDDTTDTDNGATYTTTIESKTFVVPDDVINITRLKLDITPQKNGTITAYFSKDNGDTWTAYKTLTMTVGKRKQYTFPKNIKGDRYSFKLVCSSGLFDLHGWEIHAIRTLGFVKQSSTT